MAAGGVAVGEERVVVRQSRPSTAERRDLCWEEVAGERGKGEEEGAREGGEEGRGEGGMMPGRRPSLQSMEGVVMEVMKVRGERGRKGGREEGREGGGEGGRDRWRKGKK